MVESEDVPVDIDPGEEPESPDGGENDPFPEKKSSGKSSSKSKAKTKKASKKDRKSTKKAKTSKSKRTKKVIKYDPTENFMVPKHEIVGEEERKELERMYGSLDLFPKILVIDPIASKLGAKEGDLIRIYREEGFYYRYVINRG